MATQLYLYETLLRALAYAEMDANFKNLRTTADAALSAWTDGLERARIAPGGYFLIGTTDASDAARLRVYGNGLFGATGRKVHILTTNGVVGIRNTSTDVTWGNAFRFEGGTAGAALGGLAGYGTDKDLLLYLGLGLDFTDTKLRVMMATGHVLFGTSTDNTTTGNARVQSVDGMYLGNSANAAANVLDWYEEATYTATATGMTTSPTGTASFTRVGNTVALEIPAISGTSNATTFTLTGGPTSMRPSANRNVIARCQDNGGSYQFALATIGTDGVITLYKDAAGGAFTNSGTKAVGQLSIRYTI